MFHPRLKRKLAISFSGGRTSAYLTCLALKEYAHQRDIVVTFANTGCEDNRTLDFVDKCDRLLGFPTIWLEAVVDPRHGVGIRHKVVDYMTASRDGGPFRAFIAKYGIPSKSHPQCTDRLKARVMESYLKTRGFIRRKHGRSNYDTAIGIRADEMDRMDSNYERERFLYPLVGLGKTKADVLAFWRSMPFDLELPGEHWGNCVWCWKKSARKLQTLALEAPRVFDFPAAMEREFGTLKAKKGVRRFFRGHRSVADIIADAKAIPFEPYKDDALPAFDPDMDAGGACGESCEIGADG